MAADDLVVRVGSRADDLMVAAGVWARATNRRDAPATPRTAGDVVDGVRDRAHDPRAVLTLVEHGAEVVGFSIVRLGDDDLELVYLATDPDAWGLGAASRLLLEVDALAALHEVSSMELWVIAGNERAITVYERAGWEQTGTTRPHPTSPARTECRLVRVGTVDASRTSVSPGT